MKLFLWKEPIFFNSSKDAGMGFSLWLYKYRSIFKPLVQIYCDRSFFLVKVSESNISISARMFLFYPLKNRSHSDWKECIYLTSFFQISHDAETLWVIYSAASGYQKYMHINTKNYKSLFEKKQKKNSTGVKLSYKLQNIFKESALYS